MRPSTVKRRVSYREWEMNNRMSPLLNAAGDQVVLMISCRDDEVIKSATVWYEGEGNEPAGLQYE